MNLCYALRNEDAEQIMVIQWSRYQLNVHPELKLLYHCPNGGSRNKAEAAKLKRMGVMAGVPDLHLPVPKGKYCGLYVEMKYENGRLEQSQREFLKAAMNIGHYCAVCYGAEEAIKIIQQYVNLKPIDTGHHENEMEIENGCILCKGKVKYI